jgi:hypothetical protein
MREGDGEDGPTRSDQYKLLHQAEDIPSQRSEQDGPSRRSQQIAPPPWRVPSRREGQAMKRRQRVMSDRRRSFPQIDSRRPFRVDNRHLFLQVDSTQRFPLVGNRSSFQGGPTPFWTDNLPSSPENMPFRRDTPVLAFARQGRLAQAMRGVVGPASAMRGGWFMPRCFRRVSIGQVLSGISSRRTDHFLGLCMSFDLRTFHALM